MITSDFHTHTMFSSDSRQKPKALILQAQKLDLKYLAITDHWDNGSVYVPNRKKLNFQNYFDAMTDFKAFAASKNIMLAIGLEIGYVPQKNEQNAEIINEYKFDYVINSVHEVDNVDCYYPEFYRGKDRGNAYKEYFNQVLQSIDAPYYFSSIGHFGYIVRKSPYPQKEFEYNEFSDIIDEILTKIIQKQKILEVNTSVKNLNWHTIPSFEILQRYYDLGGRLINFGSDAHYANRLGDNFEYVSQMVKNIGFKYLTLCIERQFFQENL